MTNAPEPMVVYGSPSTTHQHVVSIWIPGAGCELSVHNVEPAPLTQKPEVAIFWEGPLDMLTIIDAYGTAWKVGEKND